MMNRVHSWIIADDGRVRRRVYLAFVPLFVAILLLRGATAPDALDHHYREPSTPMVFPQTHAHASVDPLAPASLGACVVALWARVLVLVINACRL